MFGGHDMNKKFEIGRFITSPLKIHIHPEWNTHVRNNDADIAILEIEENIQFTKFIQPICMWEVSFNPTITSGWIIGYNENRNIPQIHKISIQENEHCFNGNFDVSKASKNRVACGKVIELCEDCLLNRGNGIFMKIGNSFYLRGISSSSWQDEHANKSTNITFTDIFQFKEWITNFDTVNEIDTNEFECGVMSKSAGLVQGNQFTLRDQFPWVVSIVFDGGFHNNGALVSDKHIITYVETVASWNKILNRYLPDDLSAFKIYLGTIKYNDATRQGSMMTSPLEIILHPYIRRIDDTPINSIAIVKMKKTVHFNKFIKPICIWDLDNDLHSIEKSQLYGVGYGRDESGNFSGIRKHAKVSVKDEEYCKYIYTDALEIFNETKLLCVQGNGRETPCFRDTPLFVKFNEKWYLRGILLRLRYWTSNGTCIADKPLLYEDISQNSQWILSQIKY